MTSATRPRVEARSAYRAFRDIATRWSDNDRYGHVNNAVYDSCLDTAVNGLLIDRLVLDIHGSEVIGLVVETPCNPFSPRAMLQQQAVPHGGISFNVYVGRKTRRPAALLCVLETLT